MLKRDDVIDLIVRHLQEAGGGTAAVKPRGRLFLSEYDVKKRLTPGAQHLTIPEGAIISPLALDWLVLQGIKVVRNHVH
jgi:hypothetical protein